MAKLINYRLSGTASTLNGSLLPLAPVLPLVQTIEGIADSPLEADFEEADLEEVESNPISYILPTVEPASIVEPAPVKITLIPEPSLVATVPTLPSEATHSKIKLLAWVVPLIALFGLGAIPVFDKQPPLDAVSPSITQSPDPSWLGEPVFIEPRVSGYHQIIRH